MTDMYILPQVLSLSQHLLALVLGANFCQVFSVPLLYPLRLQ